MTLCLPIIDLTAPAAEIARELDIAARAHGFFYIRGYKLDDAILKNALTAAEVFFAEPLTKKSEIAIAHSNCHRGWFREGEEILNHLEHPEGDYKEGIKIGNDLASTHPLVQSHIALHGENQWPNLSHYPHWRAEMQTCYDALSRVSHHLLRCFADALTLPSAYFAQWFRTPMATLTPLRYPPYQAGRIGAAPHTDFGCLTLLVQTGVGGLEVLHPDLGWQAVPPIADTLVVNIGDMLERWTNDRYRSTLHRVINRGAVPRYSMAFFFDPDAHADITPLASCIGADGAHYPSGQALAHLLEKIDASFDYRQSGHSKVM